MTVKYLAHRLGVSVRTVRYDSIVLANWLDENGTNLERRPRVGYFLADKEAGRRLLKAFGEIDTEGLCYYTASERVNKIISLILSGDEPIVIKDIMDRLYVSRSTVLRDLAVVREWFSSRGIELRQKPNQGIQLHVGEQAWRELVADWIKENVEEEDLSLSLLGMLVSDNSEPSKTHEVLKYLDKILTIANFNAIRRGIAQVCDQIGVQLSDAAFVNLLIHIAIAANRLLRRKQIVMDEGELAELKAHKVFSVIGKVFSPLFQQYGLQLPQSEIGFMTIYFLGAQRVRELEQSPGDNASEEIIQIVLRHVREVHHIDLQQNRGLIKGLELHLQPAIFRTKYDITVTNPLLGQVKANYPATYRLCCDAFEEIYRRYGIHFDENEIGFIALHIEAALKSHQGRLLPAFSNVALVCATGLGSAKILAANIQNEFPNFRVVKELSVMDIADYDFSNVHLVISTIRLPMPLPVPVIRVKAVLDRQDILLIRSYLHNRTYKMPDIQQLMGIIEKTSDVRDKAILEEQLKIYFEETAGSYERMAGPSLPQVLGNKVLLKQRAVSWSDAVRQSCGLLVKNGDILPGYVKALIAAKEQFQQYSFIGPGMCMPHAIDFENVNRLALVFYALADPILVDIGYGDPQVLWLMVTLAMPDSESHLPLLGELNALIGANPNFAREVAACNTSKEVLESLERQLAGIS